MTEPPLPGAAPPWALPHFATDPPGAKADVVVIGAGIAGLALAEALATQGADVLVLEGAPRLGEGASGRGLGRVRVGHVGHPSRLADELGRARAIALLRFSAANRDALSQRGLLDRCGSLAVALLDDEAAQLEPSLPVLAEAGVTAELWTAAQVTDATGSIVAGPALHVPDDGRVDPGRVLDALATGVRTAGGRVVLGARVHRVADGVGADGHAGQRVELTWQDTPHAVSCDAVVCAAGHATAQVVPWFQEKVFPTRMQYLATDGPDDAVDWACPGVGQTGWIAWDQLPDGRRVFGGCRYATMSMGVWEDDVDALSAKVERVQRGVIAKTFPSLDVARFTSRWASIEAHTCDALPLVGPVPGRPAVLACVGFGGLDASYALGAGMAVAQGLLTGTAPGVPGFLRPDRFV